ncbi:hypothetical protein [Actinomadura parmotrematis]|uniref:Secreted protein n=1 Tax=Actinomadura parmotrematis TaxID=2864039 RepID=A0ABS7G702_9ACTN|nr:hypothetical protein [Actinomadura parmotrematis]MBW8487587.1 hypothetical protein [Actinomadura parmotrematis]
MRKSLRRRLSAGAAALAMSGGAVAGVAAAPAASADTLPSFSFAACPKLPAGADPVFWQCNVAVTYGGTFQLGKLNQTISSPITLTYANGFNPDTGEEGWLFGGFSASKMLVQKGIFGDPFVTAIYAQPQYAGGFGLADSKVQLNLKVQVQNPLLGGNCYIGSNSNPIKLNLQIPATTPPPPNKPIEGSPPVVVQEDPPVLGATLVDNSFAVPGAKGCGAGLGVTDALVNLYAGLPSAAGHNTAIFKQYVSFKTYDQLG